MNTIRQKIFCFYLGYYKKQALKLISFNTVSTCCRLLTHEGVLPRIEHSAWRMNPFLLLILREPSPDGWGGRAGGRQGCTLGAGKAKNEKLSDLPQKD